MSTARRKPAEGEKRSAQTIEGQEPAGYAVDTAANGNEAIEFQRKQPAQVIITDIIMPEKHGIDTISEMQEKFPAVKIIAISGGGGFGRSTYKPEALKTTAYLAAAKEAGADRVFAKPFDRKELIQAVEDLLNMD
jgi:YesN/AraC family two-component response regulator